MGRQMNISAFFKYYWRWIWVKFRSILFEWSWGVRITAAFLVILLLAFAVFIHLLFYGGEYDLPYKLLGCATILALIATIYNVLQNLLLSRFLQDFIGLKQYTYEAAKRYLRAKERVLGVLGYWQVGAMLEFALTNCKCDEIIFIGKIENDTLPGVIWRLSLNAERQKRELTPMKIFHVDRTSLLFVVIDEKTVLIEQIVAGRSLGRVFDDSPELATDYATVFDCFYTRTESAETKVIEYLYNFIIQRFQRGREMSLDEVENSLLDITNFNRKKEYRKYIGESKFRVMLQHYINEIVRKYPDEFKISGETGRFMIKIC